MRSRSVPCLFFSVSVAQTVVFTLDSRNKMNHEKLTLLIDFKDNKQGLDGMKTSREILAILQDYYPGRSPFFLFPLLNFTCLFRISRNGFYLQPSLELFTFLERHLSLHRPYHEGKVRPPSYNRRIPSLKCVLGFTW